MSDESFFVFPVPGSNLSGYCAIKNFTILFKYGTSELGICTSKAYRIRSEFPLEKNYSTVNKPS